MTGKNAGDSLHGWMGLAIVMLLLGGVEALAQPPRSKIVFQVVPGEQTGLQAIMEKWKAEELKRQGGKFGSHGWWPWGLVAFDYDNDGCLDLLLQHHGSPGSIIVRGLAKEKGKLSFVNVTEELGVGGAVLPGTARPHIWDIDGDGFLDIVGTDAKPNTCFFNKGGKKFEAMGFGFGQLTHLSPVLDLNGDGYPDVRSLREGNQYFYDPKVRTFRKSAYVPPVLSRLPEAVTDLLKEAKEKNRFLEVNYLEDSDLNGDGRPDVVVSGFASYGGATFGRFLIADAQGKLSDQTAALGLPAEGTPILVMDLTGDGVADVLIAASPQAGLYVNDGKGKFTLQEGELQKFLANRGSYLHKVLAVDFNRDGLADLVLSNPRLGLEAVFENLGGGKFERVLEAKGWDADPIALGDFNDDGLIDLAIGGPGDTVTIYLNQTAAPGNGCQLLLQMDKPNPFAAGARAEVFRAGELGQAGARPIWVESAHADGRPIFLGLGAAKQFDVRVVFPGKTVEQRGLEARGKWRIQPQGKAEGP